MFSDDDCITSSRKTFEKNLEDGKELLLIEEIKPVRILDKDVILNRVPRTLDVSKMEKTFGPIEHWDTSFITRMDKWFMGNRLFNKNLNNWNVSSVKNMNYMFLNCLCYNQPMTKWNVSKDTMMNDTFLIVNHLKKNVV